MKVQKPKRDVFIGYVSIQLAVFGLPFLLLFSSTGNIWWGLGILGGYLLNEAPVWHGIKYGVPKDAIPPRILAPSKDSTVSPREAVLRFNLMLAHKALACGYAMLLFGVLVAYQAGDAFLGAIIGTVGIFCTWQALKGIRHFAYLA